MSPSPGQNEAIRTNTPGTEDGAPAPIATSTVSAAPEEKPHAAPAAAPMSLRKKAIYGGLGLVVLAAVCYFGIPWLLRALNTVSTDDAYVNGHVTFVAARVAGQVIKVRVDDNNRVKKGDLLVMLDPEPYQVQVNIKKAFLTSAEAEFAVAKAQVRGLVAQARSNRYKLMTAMQDVNRQISQLRDNIAAIEKVLPVRKNALDDYNRYLDLMKTKGATTQQELDLKQQNYRVAKAQVQQALQGVFQIRAGLGLPNPEINADDLTEVPKSLAEVPPDLDQNYSGVRQALADLLQSAAQLGVYPKSYDARPKKIIEEFLEQDPEGNLDHIYAKVIEKAPTLEQAKAKIMQTQRDLDQALLNLSYCKVYAEIDGVVTRRNINEGNNVQAGQSLMAIRSLTEIWIDANFKETQLRDLRIGQRVELDVDMYGSRKTFEGRITGFTMGTGQTLALLPPQNATGNFVKIVQRLPVRIELTDYNPDRDTLFIGVSVEPFVYFKEPATGPDAGKFLQPPLFK